MLKQTIGFLAKDSVQRIEYAVLIPLWAYIWYIDDLKEYPNKSFLEMSWLIPTALLLFQVLFNNKIMWAILFCVIAIYAAAGIVGSAGSLFKGNGHILDNSIMLIVSGVLVLTFYLLRPRSSK